MTRMRQGYENAYARWCLGLTCKACAWYVTCVRASLRRALCLQVKLTAAYIDPHRVAALAGCSDQSSTFLMLVEMQVRRCTYPIAVCTREDASTHAYAHRHPHTHRCARARARCRFPCRAEVSDTMQIVVVDALHACVCACVSCVMRVCRSLSRAQCS